MNLTLFSGPVCAAKDVSVEFPLVLLSSGVPVAEADAEATVPVPVPVAVPVAAAAQTFKPKVAAVNFSLLEDRAEEQILSVSC